MTIRRPNPTTLTSDPGDTLDFGGAFRKATIGVGAKVSNTRAITIQLKSGRDANMLARTAFMVAMYADAAAAAYAATGGSTGLVDGATGKSLPIVAKKLFHVTTDAAGLAVLSYTDTGTEAVFLAVLGPSGAIVAISTSLA